MTWRAVLPPVVSLWTRSWRASRPAVAELDPQAAFLASGVAALVLHGDADRHISHPVARDTAARRPRTDWHAVTGDGHGFPASGDEALEMTAHRLKRQARPRP